MCLTADNARWENNNNNDDDDDRRVTAHMYIYTGRNDGQIIEINYQLPSKDIDTKIELN